MPTLPQCHTTGQGLRRGEEYKMVELYRANCSDCAPGLSQVSADVRNRRSIEAQRLLGLITVLSELRVETAVEVGQIIRDRDQVGELFPEEEQVSARNGLRKDGLIAKGQADGLQMAIDVVRLMLDPHNSTELLSPRRVFRPIETSGSMTKRLEESGRSYAAMQRVYLSTFRRGGAESF